MLAFPSPAVEHLYQSTLKEAIAWSALGLSLVTVFSWTQSMLKILGTPHVGVILMPSIVCAGLLNFIPSLLVVAGIAWRPDLYKQRWRFINASLQILQVFCWNSFRAVIYQQSVVPGSTGQRGQEQFLAQAFFIENIFLAVVWLRMIGFPSWMVSDIAITTATLATAVLGNAHFCASQVPPKSLLATQQEPLRSIAQLVSDLVLESFAPIGGIAWSDAPPPSSCAALLGFWQVVGWWLACLAIILRDVICRMVFWRDIVKESGAHGRQELRGTWPFDNASVLSDILCMLGFSCLGFALLLGCVLFDSAEGELLAGVALA